MVSKEGRVFGVYLDWFENPTHTGIMYSRQKRLFIKWVAI